MNRGDAATFQAANQIRISFGFRHDLESFPDRHAIAAAVALDASHRNPGNVTGQLFRFAKEMAIGDRVLTFDKERRIYAVGTITGPYRFDPQAGADLGSHVRAVRWDTEVSRDDLSLAARNTLGSLMTVFEPDDRVATEIDNLSDKSPERVSINSSPTRPVQLDGPELPEKDDLELIRRDIDTRAHELIKDTIVRLNWEQMQELVAAILRAMGYKTRVSPPGSDRGVDVFASPDGLGLELPRIKVEVKHRQNNVGAPMIRAFLGGLHRDDRALYVSTGGFSKDAHYEADRSTIPIRLLNLDDIAELLVENYDTIDADGRALVPLKRVFFPA